MVNFDLGKEIEKDGFFVLTRAWDKYFSLSHARDVKNSRKQTAQGVWMNIAEFTRT